MVERESVLPRENVFPSLAFPNPPEMHSYIRFGIARYCTAYLGGNFFNLGTLAFSPIPNVGRSLKLSARDSDSAATIATAVSANGNTGKFGAREPERKDWQPEARVEISSLLRLSIPAQARF